MAWYSTLGFIAFRVAALDFIAKTAISLRGAYYFGFQVSQASFFPIHCLASRQLIKL